MKNVAFKIPVLEFERDWGSKVDDHMVCLTSEDAQVFKTEFNSKNTEESAPDWYMVCEDNSKSFEITDSQMKYLTEHNRVWLSVLRKK
jgi:hypothetical protein